MAIAAAVLATLLTVRPAAAEVVRIEILKRIDDGRYERLIGRIHFAIDPDREANRGIADLTLAPRNPGRMVEFSSDVLVVRPKNGRRATGTAFVELVNRGRDQSLGLLSAAGQTSLDPEKWNLGDRFALEQGLTVAFLGWQIDVTSGQGLGLRGPVASVDGIVRASIAEASAAGTNKNFAVSICAANPAEPAATLTFRRRIDEPGEVVPRDRWLFSPNGCVVHVESGLQQGLYEAVYTAHGSPLAGLGFAAARDFASYLKHGPAGAPLREEPALVQRVLGFGYSQSGRFLRELVRDGFNADEDGRIAFDGMMISSAGAGGGSFNHRFAVPGQAGNSVLSILRPVDMPPFDDDGLLARARQANVVPKIVYTFSSSEYWARAGSLTHTNADGTADAPMAESSRLYFLTGTPHAAGPFPPGPTASYSHAMNFAEQRWVLRALLVDLEAWMRTGKAPPASQYPTIAARELVVREAVSFPAVASLPFPAYLPQVWRMDFGDDFARTRVVTREPPALGAPFTVLVPQVDADGNELGGVRLPAVAAPLGTYTGWNIALPALPGLHYLAGLIGSFEAFAPTRRDRDKAGDARRSIAERYRDKDEYLERVERAVDDLIRKRLILDNDRDAMIARSAALWDVLMRDR